jgi:NAD(P)-dependent dehydrogenase (short-subunit alcohol dehydrogenase family)
MNAEVEMSTIVSFEGKVVVVTGAATGVGAALVEQLRVAGAARIIGLDIKRCSGPVDQTIPVDLADPLAISEAVNRLPESIDVLFNNAGVAATMPTEIVMAVNVLAPKRLITALQQRMPVGGAVVNTASTAGGGYIERLTAILELLEIDDWDAALTWVGEHSALTNNSYGFSKECAQVLTLRLAKPLGYQGIRINSACLGIIETPLLSDFKSSMGEQIIDWMVSQSGGRRAAPAEVASVLAFLGSDAARYVSGTNMLVDNGLTAAILTNQADYSPMPAVDSLLNASAT